MTFIVIALLCHAGDCTTVKWTAHDAPRMYCYLGMWQRDAPTQAAAYLDQGYEIERVTCEVAA